MTEKKKKKKKLSFEEKFGLKGQGKPIEISQRTQDEVNLLIKKSELLIESGKFREKYDTTRYNTST